ncbi:MAG TPA: UDP-N-acetylmuramoyl-tripeptide--D-alanyl-D-alanine ligase [Ignavibacteriaceae bacterium]|nr:UDP-N-acetylmuramoyl-tripeptide--D-alanyl-D-alanine ligase [Ignavibacteriaceae bacterium]
MKKVLITLQDLFNLQTARIYNPDAVKNISNVSIDSRTIKKKSLYIAIKGNKFDGHSFVNDAVNKGASAVLINEKMLSKFDKLELPIITVKDTSIALGQLANVWRNKLSAKVIGITGSNGKTTTKEITTLLLSEKYKVVSTVANNNNHIGVPLTLFSANEKTEVVVLELGTNHFGEIPYTAAIAQPDFSIITNIGYSHIEFLKTPAGVKKEKQVLFDETAKRNGIVIINSDDKLLKPLIKKYRNSITYGFSEKNTVSGEVKGYTNDGRTILEIKLKKEKINVELPIYGLTNARNILASVAIAYSLGLSKTNIIKGIGKLKPIKQRLVLKQLKDMVLIDDTYNANPASMQSAFELMSKINLYNKKIAILGDMFELGEKSLQLHKGLAAGIKKNGIGMVFTIGKMMKHLSDTLQKSEIIVQHFSNRNKLVKFLEECDLSNSVVLVKGSRGMKMEDFLQVIINRESN